jgi:hypothetical protein
MRRLTQSMMMAAALPAISLAQEWELGAAGGYGFYHEATVAGPAGQVKAGASAGLAAGGILGQTFYRRIAGEVRYTYRKDNFELSSGSQKATFTGESHALHYDVILHSRPPEAAVRPFLAAGAGVKFYRGLGAERAFQPLNRIAVFTQTHEIKPLLSVGGGIAFKLAGRASLRLDFRDYITPFPKQIIAPVPPGTAGRWLHDFVPMLGVSFAF